MQGVDRFNVHQEVELSNLDDVERNLDRLLAENEHFSIYAFPFTNRCQINTWNRSGKPQSTLGPLREHISISLDAMASTWAANLLAYSGLLRRFSMGLHRLKMGSGLVLESSQGFNRTMYPLHQELEFAIPYEQTFTVLRA